MVRADEGTIGRYRGKARCKSPYLEHQLSAFFAPAGYIMVKIVHSSYEVVLQTTKHTVIYPDSGPSLEAITLHPMV
jgi:hypothetical protein